MEKRNGIIIGLAVGLVIAVVGFFFLHNNNLLPSTNSTISGELDINGVIPEGATVTVLQKEHQPNTSYEPFAQNLPAQDGYHWQFDNAKAGTSYEIQANLIVNGNVVSQSSPLTVTAPASNEALRLNISSDNPSGEDAVISGTIGVNGYIPQGASINVEGREQGETNWTVVASNLPAKDNQFMSYTTAVAGQTYEVRGILYNGSGTQIGTSSTIVVTAPAANEALHINSTATAPTPQPQPTTQPSQPTATPQPSAAISGSINFNGQAPSNSRIVVFSRPSGTQNYQVAQDNISPQSGSGFKFSAKAGQSYDIVAILKQRQSNGTDKDISDSNTITVTAPAANEVFTINSGFTLPAASGTISVACGNYDSSSQTWNAAVSFESISGAQSYWYQIGTTNGGIELANQTQNATNNPTQSYQEPLKNGVTYYARYAYANVQNQSAYSNNFSPFSQTQQLRCAQ